jgi:hypothetical protein
VFIVTRMPLLLFVATETGVWVPLPSKLTSASAAIPAFMPCLPSRCLAMDYSDPLCYLFIQGRVKEDVHK